MDEQKKTSGSLALNSMPQVITIPPSDPVRARKLRVAAYARVSSSSEDQLNSFAAQNAHYTELITANPEWEFVDVYADKGITGTSAEKRDDFQRLLADCRRGRVDKVLVKSSSRFARNAKECLEAIRELKALGVGVCFEEQGIDTSELAGEFLTAIFAMMDQKESESISDNMRWSYQARMKSGHFSTCKAPFGYNLVNGKLEINTEEAPIIRLIFDRYLQGHSMDDIAKEVTEYGVPTRDKRPYWQISSIQYVLRNEKYIGQTLLQKTYATETLPRQRKRNRGEREQYMWKETHPPIISRETFDQVQRLLGIKSSRIPPKSRDAYPFTQSLFCGACGAVFKRKPHGYWMCSNHEKSRDNCPVQQIPETEVEYAFLHLYHKLRHQGISILTQLLIDLQSARKGRLLWSLDIVALNQKIADITRQDRLLAQLKQQGLVDPDIFISRRNELAEQLRAAKLEKERFLEAEEDQTIQQTQELIDTLEAGPDLLDAFDGELFRELVDQIIVESNNRLRFRLANGLELTEPIERTVR
ncbi:recombinase family protein [Pseudoflavonifractor phocaeensis]|uniref:recombinase family protein n=1 Tax=Pseudoflavonifractor phocaeensis TaxID=1870988 RepID=UPI001957495E|nr:recombinase family protein [Pseudoflavonifractor phocaeensis]